MSAPQQPVKPVAPATPNMASQAPKESNKMIFFLVGGVIVIALVVGGIFWYLSNQQKPSQTANQNTNTAVNTKSTNNVDSLNQDLNSIDVQASDSAGFDALDRDLQNL